MKVLIVRHAQSENNIVQAEAHHKLANGEITAEDAQVICLTRLVEFRGYIFFSFPGALACSSS
jgi:hypothetical protein